MAANAASAQGSSVLIGTWVGDMTSWDWGAATMQITNVGRDGTVEGSVNFGNGYGFVFGQTLDAKSSPQQSVGNFTGTTLTITTAQGGLYNLDLLDGGRMLKGQFIRRGQPGPVRFDKR